MGKIIVVKGCQFDLITQNRCLSKVFTGKMNRNPSY